MAKRTTTETFQSSTTNSREHSQSQSQSQCQSTTKKLLDSELLSQILGGLAGSMTDKEIAAFAENLLRPQLNAALEESRQFPEQGGSDVKKLLLFNCICSLATS